VSERAGEDDVGIAGIDYDAADAAGVLESHLRPRFSGVGGFVNAHA
jgi:hypothetical protein